MTAMRSPRQVLVGILLALAMVSAACGGGGDSEARPTTTGAFTTIETSPSTTDPTSATTAAAASTTTLPSETDPTEAPVALPPPGWTTFTTDDGLPANDVVSVDMNADGTLWAMIALDRQDLDLGWTITTENPGRVGLARWEGTRWQTIEPPTEIDGYVHLAAGPGGTAWLVGGEWQVGGGIWNDMAMGTQGLWHYDGDAWTTFFEGRPEPGEHRPISAETGPDGILWSVGRRADFDTVLLSFDGDSWETYEPPVDINPGDDHGERANVLVDSQNRIWVIARDTGEAESTNTDVTHILARLDDEGWTQYRSDPFPIPHTGATIGLDEATVIRHDGTAVWFMIQRRDGASGQAAEYHTSDFTGTEWAPYSTGSLTPDPGTAGRLVIAASAEHIYVAGLGGLQLIERDTLISSSLTSLGGLASAAIRSLTIDIDDTLWIGTNGGIARYVPDPS